MAYKFKIGDRVFIKPDNKYIINVGSRKGVITKIDFHVVYLQYGVDVEDFLNPVAGICNIWFNSQELILLDSMSKLDKAYYGLDD